MCRDEQQPSHVATLAWDESAIVSDDPVFKGTGATDTGENFHAAPDLDHTSQVVQDGLSDYAKCAVLQLVAFIHQSCSFTMGCDSHTMSRSGSALLCAAPPSSAEPDTPAP
jgi:hypothetical protein